MRRGLAAAALAAALCARAGAVELVDPVGPSEAVPAAVQIQDFRRLAGLPPLQAATLQSLALSPQTAEAARVEAAQALLARIHPLFSTAVGPDSAFVDSPTVLEYRRAVAAARLVVARAGVANLSERLSDENGISAQKLERAYTAPAGLLAQASALPGLNGEAVRAMIADGAPRHAADLLGRWSAKDAALRRPRLLAALKTAPRSAAVDRFGRGLDVARRLLGEGKYGRALRVALDLQEGARGPNFSDHTTRALYLDAAEVVDKARRRGMAALYGARGPLKAAALAARVAAIAAKNPDDFAGEPLSPEATRIQCYGDCAIQQSYNHPSLSALAEQMPYRTFLSAMEGRLQNPDARHEGLMTMETAFALKELGLKVAALPAAKDERQLVAQLKVHGALLATIRFTPAKSVKERGGNHAVVVRAAFRDESGWNFVVIDSNHARPQVMTYDELKIFSLSETRAVAPMPESDPTFNRALKGVPDPSARLRLAIHLFYGKYAAVRLYTPWYSRLFAWAANLVRDRLGLEPLEPRQREVVDANLVWVGRLPAAWKTALARGLKLPKEAVVTAPDGRKFLNRLVVERTLDAAGPARYP